MSSEPDQWLWPVRWEDFQHYRPERDRPPAWIKAYVKQLLDFRYRALGDAPRSLLADARLMFASTHGRVRFDPAWIGRMRGARTRQRHLDELVDAGFIEVLSRPTLDRRLEQLYSPPRVRVEVEVERETPQTPLSTNPEKRAAVCPDCGLEFKGKRSLAEHVYHSHDGPEPAHWVEAERKAHA